MVQGRSHNPNSNRIRSPLGRMAVAGRLQTPGTVVGRLGAPDGKLGAPDGKLGAPDGKLGAPDGKLGVRKYSHDYLHHRMASQNFSQEWLVC
jgi:hypothetical protein